MTRASSGADKPAGFRDIQYQFTRHIRDPEHAPAPAGIEDRRMRIYRDLLYNNVEDFLANGFPVLREITPQARWQAMVRDYFRNHQARTPLFPKMPQEFLQYLARERQPDAEDYPFIQELAHYEWLELAISIDSREIPEAGIDINGDLLAGVPVLSPLAWPFSYRYPVHRISPDFLPREAPEQPTYLVVYRDRGDEVGFLELNPVSARLVEKLQAQSGQSGKQMLLDIAEEIQHPEPQVVVNGGVDILESMRGKDIIPGVRTGTMEGESEAG